MQIANIRAESPCSRWKTICHSTLLLHPIWFWSDKLSSFSHKFLHIFDDFLNFFKILFSDSQHQGWVTLYRVTKMEADNLSLNSSTGANLILVRVGVPELNVEKCLQFHKDEIIWEVKQQALSALPKVRKTATNIFFSIFTVGQKN